MLIMHENSTKAALMPLIKMTVLRFLFSLRNGHRLSFRMGILFTFTQKLHHLWIMKANWVSLSPAEGLVSTKRTRGITFGKFYPVIKFGL